MKFRRGKLSESDAAEITPKRLTGDLLRFANFLPARTEGAPSLGKR